MTVSDALKVLAGELEVRVVPIDKARRKGFEVAMKLYMVSYPCKICKKPIQITSEKDKETVRGFMIEQGWVHSECYKQSRLP
jgi:hypothetical protein